MSKKQEKFDKRIFKKSPEELEQYMMFKRRGSVVESKKGKGSFKRKPKHPQKYEDQYGPVVKRLRRQPLTLETRVRFPAGSPLRHKQQSIHCYDEYNKHLIWD